MITRSGSLRRPSVLALSMALLAAALAFPAAASAAEPVADFNVDVAPYTQSKTVPISIAGDLASYTDWGITYDCQYNNLSAALTSVTLGGVGDVHSMYSFTIAGRDVNGICHTVTRSVMFDPDDPYMHELRATPIGITAPRFQLYWAATDNGASGVASVHVLTRDLTTNRSIYGATVNATDRSAILPPATPGHAYSTTAYATDKAGNISPVRTITFRAPADDRAFTFSGFVRQSNAQDYMGSHAVSSRAGSYFTFTFTGQHAWVGMIKSRSCGYVDVFVDGVRKSRVNLYSETTRFRQQLKVAAFADPGRHVVTLRVLGAHEARSIGSNVYADSLTTT
jgi:hypothetical protein